MEEEMRKKIFSIILFMGCSLMVFSDNKIKIGIDYFSINDLPEKIEVTPIVYPGNGENIVFHQDIGNEESAYLIQDRNSFNYKFYFYNYITHKIFNEVHIEKEKINHSVEKIYFTKKCFYILEKSEQQKLLTKRNFFGDIQKTWLLKLDISDSIKSMIVDEKQDVVILSYGKEKNIIIYSLNNDSIIYKGNGKLLFNITNDTGRLYYSNSNELIFTDYETEIKTNVVKTFVKANEEIVELLKANSNYILVTEKRKENYFLSIVFNTYDWENKYYYCSLKDNRMEKIKKIYTKNKGIIFN